MRLIGIDFGTKRVGIAISDDSATLAFPKNTIPNDKNLFSSLKSIIKDEKINEIVIGESLKYDNSPNIIMKELDDFKNKLSDFKIPIHLEKEFMTSLEARRYKSSDNDASAAALILQRYLDKVKNEKG